MQEPSDLDKKNHGDSLAAREQDAWTMLTRVRNGRPIVKTVRIEELGADGRQLLTLIVSVEKA